MKYVENDKEKRTKNQNTNKKLKNILFVFEIERTEDVNKIGAS